MSKVTSKLQVTVPKAIAEKYRIKPGDSIEWVAAGDSIGVLPVALAPSANDTADRLRLFDLATARQRSRDRKQPPRQASSRGWSREDLYTRGRSR